MKLLLLACVQCLIILAGGFTLLGVVKVKTHPLQTTINTYFPWPKPLHSYEQSHISCQLPIQSKMLSSQVTWQFLRHIHCVKKVLFRKMPLITKMSHHTLQNNTKLLHNYYRNKQLLNASLQGEFFFFFFGVDCKCSSCAITHKSL